eukprot:TRINITY_DN6185_c0_g1_i1.p1 TRINITY_DN6185_c0_g1~~TRINITY_DN6185_c0_g1_i1.p1  ORF type:complete len:1078 (-),score=257.60 TRINITY_DN6185_c0_g1_i1:254-3487(-)
MEEKSCAADPLKPMEPSKAQAAAAAAPPLSPVRQMLSKLTVTAKINVAMVTLQAVAVLAAVGMYGTGERWSTGIDPRTVYHSGVAALILLPVVIVEASFLLSAVFSVHGLTEGAPASRLTSLRESLMTLCQYLIKYSTLLSISVWEGGIVHTDSMCLAGLRPVFSTRLMQWSLCTPLMLAISNESVVGPSNSKDIRKRDWASLLNTFMYCWSSWAAQVCPAPAAVQWGLLGLAWVAFVCVCIDQICLYREQKETQQPMLKGLLVGYQIACFAAYGVTFFGARVGLITAFQEVALYSYGDVTVKLLQGAINTMIRSRDDVLIMCHWWSTAACKGADLERLMRSAAVPILSTTLTGEITSWNDMVASLTGIPEQEAKGQQFEKLVCPECQEEVAAAMKNRSSSPLNVVIDKQNGAAAADAADADDPTTSKQKVKLIMKFVVQRSQDSEAVGLVAIGQDLTEVVLLRETEERQARLSGVLSHELKSPLHGIIGLSSVMAQTEEVPLKKKQLEMMRSSATRLRDMVSDIMEMTAQHELRQRNGGQLTMAQEQINVLNIVNEVVTMTKCAVNRANRPLLGENMKLINACPSTVPAVRGNHSKLTQLLYNLVTNACKFTKEGSVTVGCRTEDNEVLIDIIDTGHGIAPEALGRIFMPFEQDHNTSNKHFEGIGLGLSIAHSIAKAHNGWISVKSQLGEGSTFTLHLPCLEDMVSGEVMQVEDVDLEVLPVKALASSRPKGGEPEIKSVTQTIAGPTDVLPQIKLKRDRSEISVLSVDDCDVNQAVIKGALDTICTVHSAMNGQEALDFLAKNPTPDLILLDVMMPVMGGLETLAEVRKKTPREELPIIMISANSNADRLSVEALSAGADDYLVKPVDSTVLKARVSARIALAEGLKEQVAAAVEEAEERVKQRAPMLPSQQREASKAPSPPGEDSPAGMSHSPPYPRHLSCGMPSQESLGPSVSVAQMATATQSSLPLCSRHEQVFEDIVMSMPMYESRRLSAELELRDKGITGLVKELESTKGALYLSELRSGALEREVAFLRELVGSGAGGYRPSMGITAAAGHEHEEHSSSLVEDASSGR